MKGNYETSSNDSHNMMRTLESVRKGHSFKKEQDLRSKYAGLIKGVK